MQGQEADVRRIAGYKSSDRPQLVDDDDDDDDNII